MKKLLIILIAALLFVLPACGKKAGAPSLDIETVTEKAEAAVGFPTAGMYTADRTYMHTFVVVDEAAVGDFVMKLPTSGLSINEYGVFIAAEGRERDVEAAIRAYLGLRKDTYDERYQGEGLVVDEGKCGRRGRYVYYVIGDGDFDALDKLFKELTK